MNIPRAKILQLIEHLSGVETVWTDTPEPFVGPRNGFPGALAELAIGTYLSRGVDDIRTEYDPVKDSNVQSINGNRQFTLSIRVKSYDLGNTAFDILERVRTRLRGQNAKWAFGDAGLGLVDIVSIVPIPNSVDDNREVSMANMDVRFNFAVSVEDDDATGNGTNYIQTVNSSGQLS